MYVSTTKDSRAHDGEMWHIDPQLEDIKLTWKNMGLCKETVSKIAMGSRRVSMVPSKHR
jgi:hypothetical protein